MPKLLTCPFCGGDGIPDRELREGCSVGEPDAFAHFVRCKCCACEGPWAKSEGNAVRQWNTRVPVTKEEDGE